MTRMFDVILFYYNVGIMSIPCFASEVSMIWILAMRNGSRRKQNIPPVLDFKPTDTAKCKTPILAL